MSRPLPRQPCAHCGAMRRCPTVILGQPVCHNCRHRFGRHPATCPGCGQLRVLAWFDHTDRPACAGCTANPPIFACQSCGREDMPFGARCGVCVLEERAAALLADGTGQIHPRLLPVYDALLAARRPQTVLSWLSYRPQGPAILQAMARGEIAISHEAFEQLPANKAVHYIRDLLVATGVLAAYHAPIERITPWLKDLLAALPAERAALVERFARWHVLRRLRRHAEQGTLTQGAVSAARNTIVITIRFLAWLDHQGIALGEFSQADMDRYSVEHPSRTGLLAAFLSWAARAGHTKPVDIVSRQPPMPAVTISDDQRWAHVELLLHDDTIPLNARVVGLITLLFAQPIARICRMRADQITAHTDGLVTITFDNVPIELPEPLDRLVLEQAAQPGQASFVTDTNPWLFPGGVPGRPIYTSAIRPELVKRGIHPGQSRKAALFQLAGQIPTPVLADILGLGDNTAVKWATLAARDWSQYAAARRSDRPGQFAVAASQELA